MAASIENLVRLESGDTAVYVWPERPEWFVPNGRGDFILSRLLAGPDRFDVARDMAERFGLEPAEAFAQTERFLRCLERGDAEPYAGRADRLALDRLRECWVHITNRCNARCTHCMFGSSPSETAELPTEQALAVVDEAAALGCELFYFTGGEPFVHEGFFEVAQRVLERPAAHLVILTNAVAARQFLPKIAGWDRERVHLQVSVDGAQERHDAVRGEGAHARLLGNLRLLIDAGFPVTLAMTVHRMNVADMPVVADLAGDLGVSNLHFMWLFRRGNATADLFAPPETIFPHLVAAAEAAERRGVRVDNIEILKAQLLSLPGTRFDLSNAGWQSLAVGPDGRVFPSPALVDHPGADCGHVRDGLETVWRQGPKLAELRAASLVDSPTALAEPMRFLLGGGDVDHSLIHGGDFVGHDPYLPLHKATALWLIAREAERFPEQPRPGFRLCMGDLLAACGEEGDGLFFTHSNCVLALPGQGGHALVRDFYARAAESPNEEILNPVHYASDEVAFIPEDARVRSYGCGSPVMDAALDEGETVVDLGSGTGVECFIAASRVGRTGRVIGIDMLPAMLARAERAAEAVAERLGYRNVEFRLSLLERLPLEDGSVDCILSNCVINLSPAKRQAFSEMLRVLRPGGRIVISDVARDGDIPLAIQYSEKLRGECLGGAFEERRLLQLLADVGFCRMAIIKRFPYRDVQGHQFYSLTFTAARPLAEGRAMVMYRGPFAAAVTDDGRLVERGERVELSWQEGPGLGESVFVFDADGNVTNVEGASSCCAAPEAVAAAPAAEERHAADCMVCGRPLVYLDGDRDLACHYCGQTRLANATCEAGHFVCDACHGEDAMGLIQHLLIQSTETDMIALLRRIRSDPAIPVHGPEHHGLVPGIMVAAYRNAGGRATDGDIRTAVRRGATICGGACAFLGACGGAVGIGTGFAILLRANPYKGHERGVAQAATAEALREIAEYDAARCCQRDCWIALRVAARLSRRLLPVPLEASDPLPCEQAEQNRECMGSSCPLWPNAVSEVDAVALD